ncbi:hypothetical protein THAOC_11014, partial [Thalassiosira oceanica]
MDTFFERADSRVSGVQNMGTIDEGDASSGGGGRPGAGSSSTAATGQSRLDAHQRKIRENSGSGSG